TTHVVRKPMPVTIPAVGTVEPTSTVQIRAQVSGQLTSIGFTEGSEVRKGQLLFTIDPRPFEAALSQAEAALARDTATANNQRAPIYVTFAVPGRYLADIRRYQAEHPLSVQVRPQAASMPGAPPQTPPGATPDVQPAPTAVPAATGTLTFVDNAVDPATGTI